MVFLMNGANLSPLSPQTRTERGRKAGREVSGGIGQKRTPHGAPLRERLPSVAGGYFQRTESAAGEAFGHLLFLVVFAGC